MRAGAAALSPVRTRSRGHGAYRGNTVGRIAEQLVVAENTIRTHSKRIYAKLDIHKKQELLDLVEAFNPKDLTD